jgi:uncharacterized protein (TIGR02246 family)
MPAYSPSEIHELFRSAFNRGDAEALIALYEPDAILVLNARIVTGREEIRKAYADILLRRGRMTLETRAVIESQEGLAVLHGSWMVESAPGNRAEPVTRGLSTDVVRKQPDGTWLCVIDNPYTPADTR